MKIKVNDTTTWFHPHIFSNNRIAKMLEYGIPNDYTGIVQITTSGYYGTREHTVYFHNGFLGNDHGSYYFKDGVDQKVYAVCGEQVSYKKWKEYKKANGTTLVPSGTTLVLAECQPEYRPTRGVFNRIDNIAWQSKDNSVCAVFNYQTETLWVVDESKQLDQWFKVAIECFQFRLRDKNFKTKINASVLEIKEILKCELKKQ